MTIQEKMNNSGLSVVLGSFNRLKFLKYAIQSIRNELENSIFPFEIIVVDGGSDDGSLDWLLKQKDIITIVQHNRGNWNSKAIERRSWGYFMNLGFKTAQGKYICMLSDDCLVIPGAIINGYSFLENELNKGVKAGALAFYWRNWPEFEKYVVFKFYGLININHGMFLREALEKVGFIDEDNYMFYAGDVDLSFKFHNAGYQLLISENSFIEHYMHANNKTRVKNLNSFESDNSNFIKKWKAVYPEMDFSPENRSSLIEKGFVDKSDTVNIFRKESGFVRLKYKARSIITGKSGE